MRSSKTRPRSKSSRNNSSHRSVGNIVNRVFDSSGPEGKVRGTPQQIIEKYNQLARDAQLSNDRVALENFQQHSEHYTRMLSEALREQEARREQHEQSQQRERSQQRDDGPDTPASEVAAQPEVADAAPQGESPRAPQRRRAPDPASAPQPDVIDPAVGPARDEDGDSGLVATPEDQASAQPKPRVSRPRTRKKPTPPDAPVPSDTSDAAE